MLRVFLPFLDTCKKHIYGTSKLVLKMAQRTTS